jgi:hypothetical protein
MLTATLRIRNEFQQCFIVVYIKTKETMQTYMPVRYPTQQFLHAAAACLLINAPTDDARIASPRSASTGTQVACAHPALIHLQHRNHGRARRATAAACVHAWAMAPRARLGLAIAWPRRERDVHERIRSACSQAAIARGPLPPPRLNLQPELTRACPALLCSASPRRRPPIWGAAAARPQGHVLGAVSGRPRSKHASRVPGRSREAAPPWLTGPARAALI